MELNAEQRAVVDSLMAEAKVYAMDGTTVKEELTVVE